jgi:hypothetical protein
VLVFDRDETSSPPDFGIPIVPDRLWADREERRARNHQETVKPAAVSPALHCGDLVGVAQDAF